MTEEDKAAAQLLADYDRARMDLRRLETEVEQAALEFGRRRGYPALFRIEHMRFALEKISD